MTGTAEEIALLEMWRAEILAGGGRIPRGDDDDESEDDFEDDFGDDFEDDEDDEDFEDDEDDEDEAAPDPDEVARAAERAATLAAARDMAGPNASTSTVNRAAAILRHGVPALVAAVRSGALPFQKGAAIVRLPAADQPGALAAELAKRTARAAKCEAAEAQRIAKRKAAREAKWESQRAEREARAARARELQERRDEKAEREYAERIAARRKAEPDLLEDRIGYRERVMRGEASARTVTLPRERVRRTIETAVTLRSEPVALRQFLEHELLPQRRGRPGNGRVRELAADAMALHRSGVPRKNLHLDVTNDPQEQRAVKRFLDNHWHELSRDSRIPKIRESKAV